MYGKGIKSESFFSFDLISSGGKKKEKRKKKKKKWRFYCYGRGCRKQLGPRGWATVCVSQGIHIPVLMTHLCHGVRRSRRTIAIACLSRIILTSSYTNTKAYTCKSLPVLPVTHMCHGLHRQGQGVPLPSYSSRDSPMPVLCPTCPRYGKAFPSSL